MQKINFNRMSTDIAQLIRQKTIFIEPITIIIGNPKYAGYSCYNNQPICIWVVVCWTKKSINETKRY